MLSAAFDDSMKSIGGPLPMGVVLMLICSGMVCHLCSVFK